MERVDIDALDVHAGALERGEQVVLVRVEILLGAPDLEHADVVVVAVGGVVQAAFWLVDALLSRSAMTFS